VQAIERPGGLVPRDESRPGKPVVRVSLCDPEVTDAGLAHLAGRKGLQELDLGGMNTGISDAGLAHLSGLKDLRAQGNLPPFGTLLVHSILNYEYPPEGSSNSGQDGRSGLDAGQPAAEKAEPGDVKFAEPPGREAPGG